MHDLVRLARPRQWAKSAFLLAGPVYGWADHKGPLEQLLVPALLAAAVFALVSSACYIVNDIVDAPKDRLHPRKKTRPIAAGAVSPGVAGLVAGVLVVIAAALLCAIGSFAGSARAFWVGAIAAAYAANVVAYSLYLKDRVIADVISLSMGFVFRVLAGCAAAAVAPSTWLLNCTLFLAMFLAFGKRLGERRIVGEDVAATRAVQAHYTDDLLRMAVVVTGVVTLVTYSGYVQARGPSVSDMALGLNPLWFTMLPATYGLLRCILLLEHGWYDDPTELAVQDWPTQLAAAVFVAITLGAMGLAGFAGRLGG